VPHSSPWLTVGAKKAAGAEGGAPGLFAVEYNFLYVMDWSIMKTMTYSESRAKYAETLDSVINDREEVIITRAGRDPVVMVALEDYESLKETAYLLRSPENARRVLSSIERLEAGEGTEHDLAE